MASLDQVVDVKINLNTFSIAKANFGIPMVVTPLNVAGSQLVFKFFNYDEAQQSGILPAAALKAVQAVFSQSPRPNQCWVGKRTVAQAVISLAEPSATISAGQVFKVNLAGKDVSYTAVNSDTSASVYTKLGGAITSAAITGVTVGSTTDGVELDISPQDADSFSITTSANLIFELGGQSSEAAVQSDLSAINLEDNGWYGFLMAERPSIPAENTIITGAAAWAETQTKLFFCSSSDDDILTAVDTDLLSTLQKKQYLRTAFVWHENQLEYPEGAWMGRCFTMDPGSETWALKNLPGITPDKLNATERQNVYKKNGNTYDQIALNTYLIGAASDGNAALGGKVVSGEWIDVVRFRDWLTDYIQKSMASLMVRQKKVPYTNAGIALLVNSLRASLRQGQIAGGISPDEVDSEGNTVPGFIIQYPNAADVPFDQKAQRVLNMSFTALLAGAIQLVKINGNLTYTYSGS